MSASRSCRLNAAFCPSTAASDACPELAETGPGAGGTGVTDGTEPGSLLGAGVDTGAGLVAVGGRGTGVGVTGSGATAGVFLLISISIGDRKSVVEGKRGD